MDLLYGRIASGVCTCRMDVLPWYSFHYVDALSLKCAGAFGPPGWLRRASVGCSCVCPPLCRVWFLWETLYRVLGSVNCRILGFTGQLPVSGSGESSGFRCSRVVSECAARWVSGTTTPRAPSQQLGDQVWSSGPLRLSRHVSPRMIDLDMIKGTDPRTSTGHRPKERHSSVQVSPRWSPAVSLLRGSLPSCSWRLWRARWSVFLVFSETLRGGAVPPV